MNPTYFDPMTHPATMRQAALMSGYDDDDGLSGLFSKIFKVASPLLSIAGPALAPFTGGASLGIAAAVNAIGSPVPGLHAFATNGRKPGEGAGAGTGVLAIYDGTAWVSCFSGAALAA